MIPLITLCLLLRFYIIALPANRFQAESGQMSWLTDKRDPPYLSIILVETYGQRRNDVTVGDP